MDDDARPTKSVPVLAAAIAKIHHSVPLAFAGRERNRLSHERVAPFVTTDRLRSRKFSARQPITRQHTDPTNTGFGENGEGLAVRLIEQGFQPAIPIRVRINRFDFVAHVTQVDYKLEFIDDVFLVDHMISRVVHP